MLPLFLLWAHIYLFRWGDYPEKLDLGYIENLINTGGWFDGSHSLISVKRDKTPPKLYAPQYFLDNEERFEYLLESPTNREFKKAAPKFVLNWNLW